jgi:hypothetical protein
MLRSEYLLVGKAIRQHHHLKNEVKVLNLNYLCGVKAGRD